MKPGKGSFQGHRKKSHFEIITDMSLAKAKGHIWWAGTSYTSVSALLCCSWLWLEAFISHPPPFCLVLEKQIKREAAPYRFGSWSLVTCELQRKLRVQKEARRSQAARLWLSVMAVWGRLFLGMVKSKSCLSISPLVAKFIGRDIFPDAWDKVEAGCL